jgi:hypothetical protein
MLGTYGMVGEKLDNSGYLVFGYVFMNKILGNYTLRMMSVYMSSIATIWAMTSSMPRWLIVITYALSIINLIFAGPVSQFHFVFPGWVLLVSVYILVINYCRNTGKGQG